MVNSLVVTFNTVVYDTELPHAEENLRAIAEAGADAIIVQDLGIARFAHALAPTLPLHASTQMTVSSPEGAAIARELGVKRIVLPRELNIEEIMRRYEETGVLVIAQEPDVARRALNRIVPGLSDLSLGAAYAAYGGRLK